MFIYNLCVYNTITCKYSEKKNNDNRRRDKKNRTAHNAACTNYFLLRSLARYSTLEIFFFISYFNAFKSAYARIVVIIFFESNAVFFFFAFYFMKFSVRISVISWWCRSIKKNKKNPRENNNIIGNVAGRSIQFSPRVRVKNIKYSFCIQLQ